MNICFRNSAGFNEELLVAQTLDDLQNTLFQDRGFKSEVEPDAMELAKCAVNGNVEEFEILLENHNKNYKYIMELKLPIKMKNSKILNTQLSSKPKVGGSTKVGNQTFRMTLTIHHLVVLLGEGDQHIEILKCLLKNQKFTVDHWKQQLKLEHKTYERKDWQLYEKNEWIEEANCLHLAAKYNPKGLHVILDGVDKPMPVKRRNLLSVDLSHKRDLLTECHTKEFEKGFSPLHVAATNIDSLSTRYVFQKNLNNPFTQKDWPTHSYIY